jgi:hypothetical protein
MALEWTWPFSSADGVQMTVNDFVEFRGSLKAGHATQPRCWAGHQEGAMANDSVDGRYNQRRRRNA